MLDKMSTSTDTRPLFVIRHYGVADPRGGAPTITKSQFDKLLEEHTFWCDLEHYLTSRPELHDYQGIIAYCILNQLKIADYLWKKHGINEAARKYFQAKSAFFQYHDTMFRYMPAFIERLQREADEAYSTVPEIIRSAHFRENLRQEAQQERDRLYKYQHRGGPAPSLNLRMRALKPEPIFPINGQLEKPLAGLQVAETWGHTSTVVHENHWVRTPLPISDIGRALFPYEQVTPLLPAHCLPEDADEPESSRKGKKGKRSAKGYMEKVQESLEGAKRRKHHKKKERKELEEAPEIEGRTMPREEFEDIPYVVPIISITKAATIAQQAPQVTTSADTN